MFLVVWLGLVGCSQYALHGATGPGGAPGSGDPSISGSADTQTGDQGPDTGTIDGSDDPNGDTGAWDDTGGGSDPECSSIADLDALNTVGDGKVLICHATGSAKNP